MLINPNNPTGAVYPREVLEAIQKRLPNFPLVMHGSSSVPQEEVARINAAGGDLKGAKGVDASQFKRAAESAVREQIAKPAKLGVLDAAWGIHNIVDENMANAARVHALKIHEHRLVHVPGGIVPREARMAGLGEILVARHDGLDDDKRGDSQRHAGD